VPLGRFALDFTRSSPLRLKRDVCRGPRQYMTAKLTGHSGKVTSLRARMKVAGCPPRVTLKRNRIRVKPGRDAAKLRSVRLGKRKVRTSQRLRLRVGKRYRVTVVDRKGQRWRLNVRVRR
jgi:hypothetical protein